MTRQEFEVSKIIVQDELEVSSNNRNTTIAASSNRRINVVTATVAANFRFIRGRLHKHSLSDHALPV